MGSQTVFGPRGAATALSKATTISAVVFMLTSLTLSILSTGGATQAPSILDEISAPASSTPAAPGTPAPIVNPTGQVDVTPATPEAPAPAPAK
jgi:preprotein translocase subunit SecG